MLAWMLAATRAVADEPRETTDPESASGDPAAAPRPTLEVEVRGQRGMQRSRRDPTAASSVLQGEALDQPGSSSADVVERAPGVQVTRTGSASDLSTVSVRGTTSAQTPIYLGGVRLNDDVSGTADLSLVPLWMIERVEVFRGNAPFEVGQLGMGGAILFEPRLPARNEIGAGAELGSYGERNVWVAGGVGDRSHGALVGLRRYAATNDYPFVDDGGTRADASDDTIRRRPDADVVTYDLWAISRHRFGRGVRVSTFFSGLYQDQGTPGFLLLDADDARTRTRRLLGAVTIRIPCGEGRPSCSVELDTLGLVADRTLTDPQRQLSPNTVTDNLGDRFQQGLGLRHDFADGLELRLRLSQSFERLGVYQDASASIESLRAVTRIGTQLDWQVLPRLELLALGALECHTTEGPGVSDPCGVLQPVGRLGAAVEIGPGTTFRANVGRYVRVPTLGELYGVSAIVRGNDNLLPENGVSADAGVTAELLAEEGRDSFSAEVFGYARVADDLIAYRQTAQRVVRPFNVGRARVLGVEAITRADLFRRLVADLTINLADPRDVSEGRTLENDVLPYQSRLTIGHHAEVYCLGLAPGAYLDRLGVGYGVIYRSSRFADPAGLIVIPGQARVDAQASAEFGEGRWVARIGVRNLLNAPQFDAVGLPLPGRTWHGNLEAWLW